MKGRRGQGIIGLLLAIVIIGWLVAKQGGVYFGGAAKTSVPKETAEKLPDQAKDNMFKLVASQVKSTIAVMEAQDGKRPASWQELSRAGMNTQMRDPWGGQYYLKDGWLRCTGNPKVGERY